jgi:hypothetical protein
MSAERRHYKSSREQVLRLYDYEGAFGEGSGRVDVHHILTREDFKKNPELWKYNDLNDPANLVPLRRSVHVRIHQKIDKLKETKPRRRRRR